MEKSLPVYKEINEIIKMYTDLSNVIDDYKFNSRYTRDFFGFCSRRCLIETPLIIAFLKDKY